MKRLSDITSTSKDKDNTLKSKQLNRLIHCNNNESREPLKEKTQEIMNS